MISSPMICNISLFDGTFSAVDGEIQNSTIIALTVELATALTSVLCIHAELHISIL